MLKCLKPCLLIVICYIYTAGSADLHSDNKSHHQAASTNHEDMLQLVYKNNPRVYYRNWRKYSLQLEEASIPSVNGVTEVEELSLGSKMEDPVWDRTTLFIYDKSDTGMESYLGAKKYNGLY